MRKILILFLTWRILLFIPLYVGYQLIPYRPGYHYTSTAFFVDRSSLNLVTHFLLSPWANFDGIYYLLIGSRGYTVEAGFFPLLPLMLHPIKLIFGSVTLFELAPYLTSIALVSFFFLMSMLLLYRLIRLDYDTITAFRSVLFLLVFPTAFFFATVYAEGLFLLLSVVSLYFARRRQWLFASLAALLLTATRPVGLAIVPALLYEFYVSEFHKKHTLSNLLQASPLLLSPMGFVGYVIFNNIKWGNPLYFVYAQGQFQNSRSVEHLVLVPQTIFRYLKIFATVPIAQFEWWVALLEFSAFFFAVALLYVAWRKKVRMSYLVFSLFAFLLPTSTGTFSALPRYIVVLFPLFLTLTFVLRTRTAQVAYIVASVFLLGLLFALFSRGFFVA